MSVEVQHITKRYGTQKALDDVSFKLSPGDIMGFLGPNGAGKSTMMKIITGFIPPDEGKVWVKGQDIASHATATRRHIGYLPENNPLYDEMYVLEYLEFVAGMYPLDKNRQERIWEIVAKTGLTAERGKKLGALSKGYRQRVGIAQALIHNPDVLILDEPTTGLDPNQIVEIRDLIREIGREKTVMLSTHIMQEVEAICDKVLIINNGRIVANDDAANLQQLAQGAKQVVRVEFGESVTANALREISQDVQTVRQAGSQWILENNGDEDLRPKVYHFAVANKLILLSLTAEKKYIEHIFQELTRETGQVEE